MSYTYPSYVLYLLYVFQIFYVCVMAESVMLTEGPGHYLPMMFNLAINICDYDTQL